MFLKVVYLVILVSSCYGGLIIFPEYKNCSNDIIKVANNQTDCLQKKIVSITKVTYENLSEVRCHLFQSSILQLCSVAKEQNTTAIVITLKNLNKTVNNIQNICNNFQSIKLNETNVIGGSNISNKEICMKICTEFDGSIAPICGYISNLINVTMQIKNVLLEKDGSPQKNLDISKTVQNSLAAQSTERNTIKPKTDDSGKHTINNGINLLPQEVQPTVKVFPAKDFIEGSPKHDVTPPSIKGKSLPSTNDKSYASANEKSPPSTNDKIPPSTNDKSPVNEQKQNDSPSMITKKPDTEVEEDKTQEKQKNQAAPTNLESDDYLVQSENNEEEEEPKVPELPQHSKKPFVSDEEPDPASNTEIENNESYFFSYFMTICVIFVLCYVGYHNKQKILALVLEGRKGRRTPRNKRPNSANYHKLDSNLEEAVTSACNKNTNTQVIY